MSGEIPMIRSCVGSAFFARPISDTDSKQRNFKTYASGCDLGNLRRDCSLVEAQPQKATQGARD